jgi:hypothetical protein
LAGLDGQGQQRQNPWAITEMSQDGGSSQLPQDPRSKEGDYHATLVAAWVNTRMERDKSVLTLSAGGIALSTTLLTTVGPHTCVALVLYTLVTVAFSIALIWAIIPYLTYRLGWP